MIEIIVNKASFEYDIHSLVKAFFSKEDVLVRVQEQFLEATKIRIAILFSDNKVQIKIWEEEKLCQEDSIEIDFEQRKETKNHLKRSDIVPLYRARTSLGDADWDSSGQDCDAAFRGRQKQCGDCSVYERHLSSKQGKGSIKCDDSQQRAAYTKRY